MLSAPESVCRDWLSRNLPTGKASSMLTQTSRPATCGGVRAQMLRRGESLKLQHFTRVDDDRLERSIKHVKMEHTAFAFTGVGIGNLVVHELQRSTEHVASGRRQASRSAS